MDEINKFRELIIFFSVLIFLLVAIPISLYFYQFSDKGLSTEQDDWGLFGDFIGGIIGTILSIAAVIFSLISVYFSLRTSNRLFDFELKRNRAFAYLDFNKHKGKKIKISLQNHGSYPLRVYTITIVYDNTKTFNDFNKWITDLHPSLDSGLYVRLNTAPAHAVYPGKSKNLLLIKVKTSSSATLADFEAIQISLSKSVIKYETKNILDMSEMHERTLGFFKP